MDSKLLACSKSRCMKDKSRVRGERVLVGKFRLGWPLKMVSDFPSVPTCTCHFKAWFPGLTSPLDSIWHKIGHGNGRIVKIYISESTLTTFSKRIFGKRLFHLKFPGSLNILPVCCIRSSWCCGSAKVLHLSHAHGIVGLTWILSILKVFVKGVHLIQEWYQNDFCYL